MNNSVFLIRACFDSIMEQNLLPANLPEVQDLQDALIKLEKTMERSQKVLSAAEAKANRNRAAFDSLAVDYDRLILENQDLRKGYNEVCDEVDSLRHDLDHAYGRLHEMSTQLKEAKDAIDVKEKELMEADDAIDAKEKELMEADNLIRDLMIAADMPTDPTQWN